MHSSNPPPGALTLRNIEAWPAHDHVEIHAIDSDTGVILDTKVNVFLDAKPKVSWQQMVEQ